MAKPSTTPETSHTQPQKPVRKRTFILPDIDGGGPAVTIDATSPEEAIQIYKKGQATA